MSNRVNRKVRHSRGNWDGFINGLKIRLSFHEEKANELKPLIADLEADRDRGIQFPGERRVLKGKSRATHN